MRLRELAAYLASAALLLGCRGDSEPAASPEIQPVAEPARIQRPGTRADGSILLPNHWVLTPAG
ncbi:MAG: hypothetical protein JRH01_21070, partial [Deltaproteobacteria bacterium]|nr:hypothetical protein [Deltaproteobacteria bacterium]